MVYKWHFSCQLGDGLCHRSHLLREPETTIDVRETDFNDMKCWVGFPIYAEIPRFFGKLPIVYANKNWPIFKHQVSNEKILACLGYMGDEILPSYMGIVINHYEDPY